MEKNAKIFIAGHTTSWFCISKTTQIIGYENLITADKLTLDLRSQAETEHFLTRIDLNMFF